MARLLLIEDDPMLLASYSRLLVRASHEVVGEGLAAGMRAQLSTSTFDVVITDLGLPDSASPDEHLSEIARLAPNSAILVLTGRPTIGSALAALEVRVYRYLVKPFELQDLLSAVQGAAALVERPVQARMAFDLAMNSLWFAWQPIVDSTLQRRHAWEALVRGTVPGFTDANQIVQAAVRTAALAPFGRICRASIAARIPELPVEDLAFVNLHPSDLSDPDLYDPKAPLSEHADRIVLELTERSSLTEIDDVLDRLAHLRRLGFRIAIDDLGAGYAGLTAVAHLRPDYVKVDMALIRNIHESAPQRAVVRSIRELCRELDISLVGEGVETTAECDTLTSLGLDIHQGYLYGRPDLNIVEPRFPPPTVRALR